MPLAHRIVALLGLVATLCFATACASRIRTTAYQPGPLADESNVDEIRKRGFVLRMESQDHLVEFVPSEEFQRRADPKAPLRPPTALADGETTRGVAFIIAAPVWDTEKGFHEDREDGDTEDFAREDEILFTIRERLYRYLLREYPHPVRVRYAYRQSDPLIQNCRLITIETTVTDIKRGDAWLRYALGYGLGQSRVQIAGDLYEGVERRKIGEFTIRRGHGGFSQNGLNPDVLDDSYTIKYAAEAAIRIVCPAIAERIPGVIVVPPPSQ